jgi:hypothetical protein
MVGEDVSQADNRDSGQTPVTLSNALRTMTICQEACSRQNGELDLTFRFSGDSERWLVRAGCRPVCHLADRTLPGAAWRGLVSAAAGSRSGSQGKAIVTGERYRNVICCLSVGVQRWPQIPVSA